MPEQSEPRFSGSPTTPPPEVFERARKNNPAWYQILERAYEQFASRPENAGIYADPKSRGATIQQIWLVYGLFGIHPYCVLVRTLSEASTQRITRLVNSTPAQLIDALRSIQLAEGAISVEVAYHDGKIGHCIRITSYDAARDRFIYHDPWPERSLLAKENNDAGIDAQPEGQRWSMTAQEFARIAFAAFIFPHQWARVQGQEFDILYEQWRASDFCGRFQLKQLEERIDGDLVRRVFAPRAFKQDVTLLIENRQSGKIKVASLRLSREWMVRNFFPLALDIAKRFVTCFAPPPDRAKYALVASALQNLRDSDFRNKLKNAEPDESDEMRCVRAFAGLGERADVMTDFAHLSIGTGVQDERQVHFIEYDLL